MLYNAPIDKTNKKEKNGSNTITARNYNSNIYRILMYDNYDDSFILYSRNLQ